MHSFNLLFILFIVAGSRIPKYNDDYDYDFDYDYDYFSTIIIILDVSLKIKTIHNNIGLIQKKVCCVFCDGF